MVHGLNIYSLPPLIVGTLIVILGVSAVALHERRTSVSLTFGFLTLAVGLWLVSFGVVYSSQDPEHALKWIRIANSGVVFIPSMLFAFALASTEELRKHAAAFIFCCVISLYFLGAVWFSRDFVAGVQHYFWGYYPVYGILTFPFLAFNFLTMAVSHRFFWKQYCAASGKTRARFKIFLTAFSVGYLGCVDYFAAYKIMVYPCGYAPVFIFVLLMAWANWRFRLIDITPSLAAAEIIRTIADALLVIDGEGIIRVANQAAARLFGGDALEGQKASAIGLDYFKNSLPRLWSGNIRNLEIPFAKKDLILELSSSAVRNKNGKTVASVSILKDITVRKRAEQQLQEREKHYRILAENISDVIWTMDKNMQWTYMSPSIQRLTGYTAEEAMALTLEQSLMPASFKAATMILTQEQALHPPKDSPYSTRMIDLEYKMKNGSSLWTEVRITFLYYEDGRTTEIMGVTRDITDRKRAEDALSQSERSYADLVKAATEPILMFDRQGILQSVNPAAEFALGYHAAELIGKHVQNILAPESVAKTLQELTLIFLGWQRAPFELHLMRKDQHLLIMEATPRLLRRDSEAAYVQILCRDIGHNKTQSPISA